MRHTDRSPDRLRQSIRDEIAFYLDMRIRELMRGGLSRDEAERRARASFGPVDEIERACMAERRPRAAERRPMAIFDSLRQDIRYAARSFRRNPLFVTVAATTLALGIGASTTMFSVLDGVALAPLPFERPDELVVVGTTWRTTAGAVPPEVARMSSSALSSTSAPNFLDWQARSTSFSAMAGARAVSEVWTGGNQPERVRIGFVTSEFFPLLGVSPHVGRGFTHDDFRAGAPRVALVSDGVWRRRFGADTAAIGRTITTAGEPFTVIGVLPDAFRPPEALWLGRPDLWIPVNFAAPRSAAEAQLFRSRGARIMRVVARLAPGISLDAARRELDVLGAALLNQYPDDLIFRGTESHIAVDTLHRQTVGTAGRTIAMLFGAVGLLLLIACVNIANLSLARGMDRQRELAVRRALGASRGRVVRQLLTESVALSLLGGTLGVLLAFLGVEIFKGMSPGGIPRLANVNVDGRVLTYAVLVSVLTGVAFGAAPAVQALRGGVDAVLRLETTRVTGATWIRQGFVLVETSMALVLLIGAGLLMNSYMRLVSVDPGFEPANVVTMQVNLGQRYESPWAMGVRERSVAPPSVQFFANLLDRVREVPGVRAAASVMNPPIGDVFWRTRVMADVPGADDASAPSANMHTVSPAFFRTMGIPIRRGRPITGSDSPGQPLVAVVNETYARAYWPNSDPIGARIKIVDDEEASWISIVGVAADVRQMGLANEPLPEVYLPYAQRPWLPIQTVVARYRGPLEPVVDGLRRAVWEVEPDIALPFVQTMESRMSSSVSEARFVTILLACFGGLALVLATGGVYATLLYTVRQRTREMGIRMALGAVRGDVVRLVVRQGMTVVVLGLMVGGVGAVLASGLLTRFVYGISPTDPTTFIAVSGVFLLTAWLASYLPARRATTVDPVATLRTE